MIGLLFIAIFALFSPVALFFESDSEPEPIKIEVSESIGFSDSVSVRIVQSSNTNT